MLRLGAGAVRLRVQVGVRGTEVVLAAVLPIPYAVSTARFWSVRDEDCERANAGWRTFLWLNLVTGFLVTMLLIAAAQLR